MLLDYLVVTYTDGPKYQNSKFCNHNFGFLWMNVSLVCVYLRDMVLFVQAELVVDGSVVRSGRSLTVVVVNFRPKESAKLAFMTRATFYNMPISSL